MTLSKKVGGGPVRIILLNFQERMTNYKEGGAALGFRLGIFKEKRKLLSVFMEK